MKINFRIIAALVAVLALSAVSLSDASAKGHHKKHHAKKHHKASHHAEKKEKVAEEQHVGGVEKSKIISGQ